MDNEVQSVQLDTGALGIYFILLIWCIVGLIFIWMYPSIGILAFCCDAVILYGYHQLKKGLRR